MKITIFLFIGILWLMEGCTTAQLSNTETENTTLAKVGDSIDETSHIEQKEAEKTSVSSAYNELSENTVSESTVSEPINKVQAPPHKADLNQKLVAKAPKNVEQVKEAAVEPPKNVEQVKEAAVEPPKNVKQVKEAAVEPPKNVEQVKEAAVEPPKNVKQVKEAVVAPPKNVRQVKEVAVEPPNNIKQTQQPVLAPTKIEMVEDEKRQDSQNPSEPVADSKEVKPEGLSEQLPVEKPLVTPTVKPALKKNLQSKSVDLYELLPLRVSSSWVLDKSSGSHCFLRSHVPFMADGHGGTSLDIILTRNKMRLKTNSNIDLTYTNDGLIVGQNSPIALEYVEKDTIAVVENRISKVFHQLRAEQTMNVRIGFWPTWPVTKTYGVKINMAGFKQADKLLSQCDILVAERSS